MLKQVKVYFKINIKQGENEENTSLALYITDEKEYGGNDLSK